MFLPFAPSRAYPPSLFVLRNLNQNHALWRFPCIYQLSPLYFHKSLQHLHCIVIICPELRTLHRSDLFSFLLSLGVVKRVKWENTNKRLVENLHSAAILITVFLIYIPIFIPPIKLRACWVAGNELCIPGTMLSMWHFQEPTLGYLWPKSEARKKEKRESQKQQHDHQQLCKIKIVIATVTIFEPCFCQASCWILICIFLSSYSNSRSQHCHSHFTGDPLLHI